MECTNQQLRRSSHSNINHFGELSANEINNFFVNIGPNTTKHLIPPRCLTDYLAPLVPHTMFLTPTTPTEIISVVTAMQPKLSSEHDGISMKII